MEIQIDLVLIELQKIKILNRNIHRENVTGIKRVAIEKRDIEFNTKHIYGYPCESIKFGTTNKRFTKKENGRHCFSVWNERYPALYNSLLNLALYVIPDDFDCDLLNITLNKNLKCIPHNDKNNGDSIIIGIGDYTGGRLILHHDTHDEYIDIKNKPYRFNGKNIKHSTEDFDGNRYSIIYYS